jgi:hypothetical protein
MYQSIGSFEKCVWMYAHEYETPFKRNHDKNPSIETLLHYFMFESKLMWHSKLRMLHYFKYHIKSPFLCSIHLTGGNAVRGESYNTQTPNSIRSMFGENRRLVYCEPVLLGK